MAQDTDDGKRLQRELLVMLAENTRAQHITQAVGFVSIVVGVVLAVRWASRPPMQVIDVKAVEV